MRDLIQIFLAKSVGHMLRVLQTRHTFTPTHIGIKYRLTFKCKPVLDTPLTTSE